MKRCADAGDQPSGVEKPENRSGKPVVHILAMADESRRDRVVPKEVRNPPYRAKTAISGSFMCGAAWGCTGVKFVSEET